MNETVPLILTTVDCVLAVMCATTGVEFLLVVLWDCSIRPVSRALLGVLTVCAFAVAGLLLVIAPLHTDWRLLDFPWRIITAANLLMAITWLRGRWRPE